MAELTDLCCTPAAQETCCEPGDKATSMRRKPGRGLRVLGWRFPRVDSGYHDRDSRRDARDRPREVRRRS
jgi:hypothetical protein